MVDVLSVLAVYSLWLNVFGTVGNLVALYICIKLSSHTTFVFLAFNCASDIITLYFWNINNFTAIILNFDIGSQIMLGCRIGYFFQFFSLQNSAWLLVIPCLTTLWPCRTERTVSLPRCLSLNYEVSRSIASRTLGTVAGHDTPRYGHTVKTISNYRD